MESNRDIDILHNIYRRIPGYILLTFCVSMVTGLLTHMYILTHKLPMWDDMSQFLGNGMTACLARWNLDYVDWLSGRMSSPWINGLLSIIFISVGTCFVVATLKPKTKTAQVLIAVMMMTFPSVTSTLGFTYTTDSYMYALMLGCMAAYFYRKGQWWMQLIACVCMVLSMGCYQAYFPVAMTILVMAYMLDTLDESNDTGVIIKRGLINIAEAAASVGIYILISNLIYPDRANNNGTDEMGQIVLSQIPGEVLEAYKRVAKYFIFKPFSFVNTEMKAANIAVAVLIVVGVVILLVKSQSLKRVSKAVLYVVLLCVMPLAMGLIYVMAPKAHVSMLMTYAYVFYYILAIILMERVCEVLPAAGLKQVKLPQIYSIVTAVAIIFVAHANFKVDNEAYFRSSIAYERVYNYFSMMMTRVESMEGYSYGSRLAIIGELSAEGVFNYNTLSEAYRIDDDEFYEFSGVALENGMMTGGARDNFLRIYLGIQHGSLTTEQQEEIAETEEFKAMPLYPAEGSIANINGVWVVKLTEEVAE